MPPAARHNMQMRTQTQTKDRRTLEYCRRRTYAASNAPEPTPTTNSSKQVKTKTQGCPREAVSAKKRQKRNYSGVVLFWSATRTKRRNNPVEAMPRHSNTMWRPVEPWTSSANPCALEALWWGVVRVRSRVHARVCALSVMLS